MQVGKVSVNWTDVAMLAVAGVGLYVVLRGWKGVASDVAAGAAALGDIAIRSASGAVIAIGKAVGVPETDPAVCEDYLRTGNTAMASLYCPAGTYLLARTGEIFSPTGMLLGFTGIQGIVDFVNVFLPGTFTPITSYSPEESGLAQQVLDTPADYYDMPGYDWETAA